MSAPESTQSWVAKRFGRVLESCARTVLGDDVRVQFDGPEAAADPPGRARGRSQAAPSSPRQPAGESLNPRLSFEQFIIGDGNRLAHAAALAVAELPGQAYNPLFLHAPPGLGKTHLLHAIGNYVCAFGGGATVRYTTVEAFTNHFITALNARSLDHFKHAYRDADVLLIDDVQFLASKAKTEEEFFHTFNAARETGRQLVLTSTAYHGSCGARGPPPGAVRVRASWPTSAARLLDESDDPSKARRARHYRGRRRRRARADRRPRHRQRPRARGGADQSRRLPSLTAADRHRARRVGPRRDVSYSRPRHIALDDIQQVVASHFGISVAELVSERRPTASRGRARSPCISPASSPTHPFPRSDGFGGRDHATVLHACRRVRTHRPSTRGLAPSCPTSLERSTHRRATGPVDTLACRP